MRPDPAVPENPVRRRCDAEYNIESFNGKLRDELLARELFDTCVRTLTGLDFLYQAI